MQKKLNLKDFEIWLITGSQYLYGEKIFDDINRHSKEIANYLNKSSFIPVKIVFKTVVKTEDEIYSTCKEANSTEKCIGLITWCHTFSPSKMWINGLSILNKPILHLHTQYHYEIPWDTIDMNFMNLNQSAHGDREHGFIMTRMDIQRKVVSGYWKDSSVQKQIGIWSRAVIGQNELRRLRIARFGDNMRNVAVTEGNKVNAQIKLGFSVNSYGVSELIKLIQNIKESEVKNILADYEKKYKLSSICKKNGNYHQNLIYQAKLEIAIRKFLTDGGFSAFTTTFEDLGELEQLPGLAVQRLMEEGFGFGAEGDWKHAALVRALKVMGTGLDGGTSFMEDYTYHLKDGEMMVLGAHMLELCPSISDGDITIDIHPLSIGNKNPPARMIFNTAPGPAINVSLIELEQRFRIIMNSIE